MKATVAKRFKKPFQTDQRCVAQHRLATLAHIQLNTPKHTLLTFTARHHTLTTLSRHWLTLPCTALA